MLIFNENIKIMETDKLLVQLQKIEKSIFIVRGQKIMLDIDLAALYGVTTKRLNEQVKRNRGRFPDDFMFKLTKGEKEEVVANCDHLFKLKYSNALPNAFTEHGAIMLASVINSPIAVQASIQVVRAFVRLREMVKSHKELEVKLDRLEKRYDKQFKVVFDAIKQLMASPKKKRNPIGFR